MKYNYKLENAYTKLNIALIIVYMGLSVLAATFFKIQWLYIPLLIFGAIVVYVSIEYNKYKKQYNAHYIHQGNTSCLTDIFTSYIINSNNDSTKKFIDDLLMHAEYMQHDSSINRSTLNDFIEALKKSVAITKEQHILKSKHKKN